MTTLILLIPSDWPQHRRDCSWLLRDRSGRIVRQGHSEPAYWPGIGETNGDTAGRPCEILLSGSQCASQRARLPQTARARSPQVIAGALEDNLLEAPEQLLFAAAEAGTDETSAIGIIAGQRLAGIVALLRELGLAPRAAWPLGMALPAGHAWLYAGSLDLALADGSFASLDSDPHLGSWLAQLPISSYRNLDRQLPDSVTALLETGRNSGELRDSGTEPASLSLPAGAGFLYGELAPAKPRLVLARHFRRAGQLAAGAALLVAVLATAQWIWLERQASDYRQHVVTRFRQAFPQATLVDPLLQMRRQVDNARRQAGQLADDDFLRLLGPLASLTPNEAGQLGEIRYEQGRLHLLSQLDAAALGRLAEAGRSQGLRLIAEATPGSFSIQAGDLR